MGDSFWAQMECKDNLRKAEENGLVADSMEVREALMARVQRGEITLLEAQSEIARIKRGARKAGLKTRNQAYRGA